MVQKKRILIDVNPVVPFFINGKLNGIGRTTKELVQSLAKIENLPFEIVLYSQNMKGIGAKNLNLPLKYKHLFYPNRDNYNKVLAKFPIREWFTHYDLMHITNNFEYVHCPERCIVTLHDALFMKFQEKQFDHIFMKNNVPILIRQCKHVITCSENSKKDIIETMGIQPDKISVIYWGICHDLFYPIKDDNIVKKRILHKYGINSPFFLSVSCNAERKRTDVLIQSYINYCKVKNLSNDLVLVWNNPPEYIVELVKMSGLCKRIHILDNVSDSDLALLYNGASAMFFVSSYEGFGLPILEAMACGTPVVTCRNSSLSEVAGNAALYVEEPIAGNLIKVFQYIDDKKVDVSSYYDKGISRASDFTWEKSAQQYVELYTMLLSLCE
jgi:glycosyltransferase involved in cell wall biosynthesis